MDSTMDSNKESTTLMTFSFLSPHVCCWMFLCVVSLKRITHSKYSEHANQNGASSPDLIPPLHRQIEMA